jgi:hypothetical protein
MIATKTSVYSFLSLTYILLFDIFYVSLSIVSSLVDHCMSFFYGPLHCLPFFDLRLLITPLVYSSYSYFRHIKNFCDIVPKKQKQKQKKMLRNLYSKHNMD